jgi:hypothetical protein
MSDAPCRSTFAQDVENKRGPRMLLCSGRRGSLKWQGDGIMGIVIAMLIRENGMCPIRACSVGISRTIVQETTEAGCRPKVYYRCPRGWGLEKEGIV